MTIVTDTAVKVLVTRETTATLRPRYEGSNISTWIGFKHINYLVEEAVLEHFRASGLPARGLYEAHGLGLDIVRRLAESTGGDVRIGSSVLGGTEVRIWIQLDGGKPERKGHRGSMRRRRSRRQQGEAGRRGTGEPPEKMVSTFNRSRSLP